LVATLFLNSIMGGTKSSCTGARTDMTLRKVKAFYLNHHAPNRPKSSTSETPNSGSFITGILGGLALWLRRGKSGDLDKPL